MAPRPQQTRSQLEFDLPQGIKISRSSPTNYQILLLRDVTLSGRSVCMHWPPKPQILNPRTQSKPAQRESSRWAEDSRELQ